jgi:UDP-glucose-4-epimerase GalE
MADKGNILVTGGAGYVGSHACKVLAAAGYTPVVFDNLSRGHERAVRFGPLEVGELADRDRLDEVFARHRPAAVLHFAALAYVAESVAEPELYHRNNVLGSLNLLEAMVGARVAAIVFSSTCAVYGAPADGLLVEDMPCAPVNPYGETKMKVEQHLADFSRDHGFRYAALRYFNAAGAAPDDGLGEDHEPETHLIPLVLDVAAGRRSDITVFGNDYETPDGTCVRDYIHVLDLADAHVRALEYLLADKGNLTLNLGTGSGYSVNEVIETAHQVTGKPIATVTGPRRDGDPPLLVANASCAHEVLGWAPTRGLSDQISDAWTWHQKNFGGAG